MSKQAWFVIFFGLFAFVLSLMLTVPAYQAYKWVGLADKVNMQGLKGRVIDGQVQRLTIKNVAVHNVSWQWQASALLSGKLAFNFQVKDPYINGKGTIAQSLWGTSLTGVKLSVGGGILHAYVPKGIDLDGTIDIDISSATVSEQLDTIDLSATTETALLSTPVANARLDNLKLTVINQDEGLVYKLGDVSKKNQIDVSGFYNLNDNIASLTGYILSSTALAQQLSSVLPLVGKQQKDRWLLSWKGKLPN
jgi:hypothetical protein